MGLYFRIKKSIFFIFGFTLLPLFSTSISLINDSAFTLNAQIIDCTGRLLDIIHLVSGQMYIYNVSQGSFEPNTDETYTPFTIIFLCESSRPYNYTPPEKDEDKDPKEKKDKPPEYISQFGIWTNVPTGATVNALGSPQGTKSCVIRKNSKLQKRENSQNSLNEGSGNWSNDGGQTWTNDANSSSSGGCSKGDGSCLNVQGSRKRPSDEPKKPKTYTDDQGNTWTNDDGNTFSNDEDKSSTPVSKWSDQSPPDHKPSKKTPLPFKPSS